MADRVIIAIRSFARGMKTFMCPCNRIFESSERNPVNVTVYFDAVDSRIERAEMKFAKEHPEVVHAD